MMTELELNLQRLVDGEMNDKDRLAFLASADANPAHWREIALAFVETQCLQEDFVALAKPQANAEQVPTNVVPLPRQQGMFSWLNAAMAAAVMILGFLLGGQFATEKPQATALAQTPSPQPSKATAERKTQASPLRVRLPAPTRDGSMRAVELPAYDESSLTQHELVERLDRGWSIDQQTRLVTGKLSDGRRVVVPVSLSTTTYRGQ